jgi:hypothetical protein
VYVRAHYFASGSIGLGESVDRQMIRDHLALAERHVAAGERHIRRQHEIIEALGRGGHSTVAAKDLLAVFERTQRSHVGDRDRLRAVLAAS